MLVAIARREPVLAAFCATYLVGFIVYGIAVGSPATPVYVVEIVGGALIVVAVHRRVPLGAGLLWALAVWGLLHLAGGMIEVGDGVLYNTRPVAFLPAFDKLVHAFGFGAATFAVGRFSRSGSDPRRLQPSRRSPHSGAWVWARWSRCSNSA